MRAEGRAEVPVKSYGVAAVVLVLALAACRLPSPQTPPTQGSVAPDFALLDGEGGRHRLSETLARGPVMLLFYRGHW